MVRGLWNPHFVRSIWRHHVLVMGPSICIYVQQGRTLCLTLSFVSGYKLRDVSASSVDSKSCSCQASSCYTQASPWARRASVEKVDRVCTMDGENLSKVRAVQGARFPVELPGMEVEAVNPLIRPRSSRRIESHVC